MLTTAIIVTRTVTKIKLFHGYTENVEDLAQWLVTEIQVDDIHDIM